VHVESDNADVGKPIMEYFGLSGEEPKVIGCMLSEEPIKYLFEAEIIVDNIKAFGEDFLADKLKPFTVFRRPHRTYKQNTVSRFWKIFPPSLCEHLSSRACQDSEGWRLC
jgi:hypothetical protein